MDLLLIGIVWFGLAVVSLAGKVYFRNYNLFCVRESQEEG